MDDPAINEVVHEGLAHKWAPKQIEGWMRQQDSERRVPSQTIYTWIKQGEERAGAAHLFSTEQPLDKQSFVYKTPGTIVSAGFEYELKDIQLP